MAAPTNNQSAGVPMDQSVVLSSVLQALHSVQSQSPTQTPVQGNLSSSDQAYGDASYSYGYYDNQGYGSLGYADASKPYAGASKPYADTSKPYADTSKPFADVSKPYTEASKPYAEASKPYAEASKPYGRQGDQKFSDGYSDQTSSNPQYGSASSYVDYASYGSKNQSNNGTSVADGKGRGRGSRGRGASYQGQERGPGGGQSTWGTGETSRGRGYRGKSDQHQGFGRGGSGRGAQYGDGQGWGGQSRDGQEWGGQSRGGQSRGGQSRGGQGRGGQGRGGQSRGSGERGSRGRGQSRGSRGRGYPSAGGSFMSNDNPYLEWESSDDKGWEAGGSGEDRGEGRGGRGRGSRGFGRGSGRGDRGRGRGSQSGGQGRGGNSYEDAGWGRNTSWRGGTLNPRGRGNQTTRGRGGVKQNVARIPNDASEVDYSFKGKLVGPERFAKNFKEYKFCQLCNVSINSSITAEMHYSGKPHMKKMKESQRKEALKNVSLGQRCELCNVPYNSVEQAEAHLNGSKHKQKLEELNSTGDTAGEDVMSGEPPLKKKKKKNLNSEQQVEKTDVNFPCDLCGVSTTSADMLSSHLAGRKHKARLAELQKKAYGNKCDICDLTYTSLDHAATHVNGEEHKKKKKEMQAEGASDEQPRQPRRKRKWDVPPKSHADTTADTTPATTDGAPCDETMPSTPTTQTTPMPEAPETPSTPTTQATGAAKPAGPNVFPCDVCGITVTSAAILETHYKGKKHKLKLSKMNQPEEKKKESDMLYSCEVCGIRTRRPEAMETHMQGKKHKRKMSLMIGPTPSLDAYLQASDTDPAQDVSMESEDAEAPPQTAPQPTSPVAPQDASSVAPPVESSVAPPRNSRGAQGILKQLEEARYQKSDSKGQVMLAYRCHTCGLDDILTSDKFIQHVAGCTPAPDATSPTFATPSATQSQTSSFGKRKHAEKVYYKQSWEASGQEIQDEFELEEIPVQSDQDSQDSEGL